MNRIINFIIFLFIGIIFTLLSGCSTNRIPNNIEVKSPIPFKDNMSDLSLERKIEQHYKIWKKTPYRYGGTTLKGIDCSSLVQKFYYDKMNIKIPRVTKDQLKTGKKIASLKAGDLIFFKTGRGTTGLHVGIYYKNGKFLHSSTSHGVTFSSVKNIYWAKHYLQSRRIVNK